MGKAYASSKKKQDRPEGDFYPTPKSLVWVAEEIIRAEFDTRVKTLEPCCGNGAISQELKAFGYKVCENDLHAGGVDYLTTAFPQTQVITNPPFSDWDAFVIKAKSEAEKVMMIGRLNYFGTNSRLVSGIWKGLKAVYCFDRYVDYRTPERLDGCFHVGAMATAWFIWERGYRRKPTLDVLSVQDFAKLGAYKAL
jgi:hypothetical protein